MTDQMFQWLVSHLNQVACCRFLFGASSTFLGLQDLSISLFLSKPLPKIDLDFLSLFLSKSLPNKGMDSFFFFKEELEELILLEK